MNKQLQRLLGVFVAGFFSILLVSAQENRMVPKTISGGVLNGKAIQLVKPEYPAAAHAANASGALNVQVTIDESGNVISAAAVSGHPLLRDAAVQAARASKFSPTLLSGQPVKVTGVIVYNFVGGERKPNWALIGLMLHALQTENSDSDSDRILNELSKSFPAGLADERAKLSALPKDERAKQELMREMSAALKNKLSASEAWQLELGENLAGVMAQLRDPKTMRERTPNETVLRTNLLRIRDLTTAAPQDFPMSILDTIRPLASFADKPDITGKDSVDTMVKLIDRVFDVFGK